MQQLAQRVINAALARKAAIALAESCTGGRVAAEICGVNGASEVFLGGVVAYSNAAKHAILGVPLETLDQFGAVSAETAHAMALGALRVFDAGFAVSITGIAGPTGATATKPVGRVYVALATPREVCVERYQFTGTRHAVQTQATEAALHILLASLSARP
ncbi:MAG: CinA family protein [Kiritimatiellaeota bacterium]|nr:CinA family protein [Kiritimatiellota bacterium]